MLLVVPYVLAAYWCVGTIEAGGPGWLNLLVLLCAWISIKLTLPCVALRFASSSSCGERGRRRTPAGKCRCLMSLSYRAHLTLIDEVLR